MQASTDRTGVAVNAESGRLDLTGCDQLTLHETCQLLDYAANALPLRAALAAEKG